MTFRISTIIWCAVLLGFAGAAQNNQRNSRDFGFNNDDADIEGSGYSGEVTHDLESSGSGFGSDDEDDIGTEKPRLYVPPLNNNPVITKTSEQEIKKDNIETVAAVPGSTATEDTSVIMNRKPEDRPTSFFAQPGILAAVIGGAVVGLLCAILVVMFIVYRMRKKDEGSYALGEPKQSPNSNSYSRGTNKEFFA